MKTDEFVITSGQRVDQSQRLTHTELTDAVNSGLVGRADKSASALKDGLYSVGGRKMRDGASAPSSRRPGRGTGPATQAGRASASMGADDPDAAEARSQGPQAKGTRRRASTATGTATSDPNVTAQTSRHLTDAVSARRIGKGLARRVGKSALSDSELEGTDDVLYSGVAIHKAGRALRRRLSGTDATQGEGSLGKLSEKSYRAKKKARDAATVQRQMQSSRYMHRSVRETAEAAASKGGLARAGASGAASGGAGGLLSLASGGAALLGGLLVLVVAMAIIGAVLGGRSSAGRTIEIPDPYGSVFSITGYDEKGWAYFDGSRRLTHHGTIASGTKQRTVWEEWVAAGAAYTSGIATTNGRFLIACTSTFGSVGDEVDFYLSDETVLHCIIADAKNPNDAGCNMYGHSNGACVVEFEVDPAHYAQYGNPGTNGWDVTGYPGINSGARTTKCVNLSQGGGGSLVECALSIASNDSVGYSMARRYRNPDMDCSSFVYYALLDSGYTTEQLGASPFTTYTMEATLTGIGFTSLPFTGDASQLQAGDILLRQDHTEIYLGDGTRVGAHSDYDGVPGDGNGNEVSVVSGLGSWTTVLRAP